MANRAYLYSCDQVNLSTLRRPSKPYYDSRWNIPLAWFFFFTLSSIEFVEMKFDGSSWKELKLITQREYAVDIFENRNAILLSILKKEIEHRFVNDLLTNVRNWQGENLVLDPSEVFGGLEHSDEWHAEKFYYLIRQIEAEKVDTKSFIEQMYYYSDYDFNVENNLEINVTGFTYW